MECVERGLDPEKLRLILQDLGPTFIKLGQIFSTRSDVLPAAYCAELTKLRADVAPMPFETVQKTVEEVVKRYGGNVPCLDPVKDMKVGDVM